MSFELFMDNVPSLIFVKDEASRIVYANRAFLEVYPPMQRSQIVGSTTTENFTAEEAAVFLAEDRRAFANGQTEIVEEIVDYSGRRRVFKTRKIAFTTEANARRLLGVCDDITELVDREKALAESNRHLQSFAALTAHDLRSPLASIVSALHLIAIDKDSNLGDRAHYFLRMVIESARGLTSNIESMLVATRAMEKGEAVERALCDVSLALEDVRFALSASIDRCGAHIISNRLPVIRVEPNLFRQLLQNLIENSLKYRCLDKPPIIFIRHEQADDADLFSIEDNGRGISTQVASRAFVAYEQNDRTAGGFGLGLSLCKKIIELHGGRIWIDTEHKNGCKIVCLIPQLAAS